MPLPPDPSAVSFPLPSSTKVDRLTRSVAFLSRVPEVGVGILFCDLPAPEGPTGRFMLQRWLPSSSQRLG
jgi:hypothetical protein